MIRALALTLTTTALLALPAAAGATGTTTISVAGAGAQSLRSQGVTTIAVPPAHATRTTWTIPFSGSGDLRRHIGGFILQRRQRAKTSRLVLTSLQLRTTGRPVLTALLAGRRITLLTFASARLGSAVLSPAAAATIRRRLGLRRTPQGRLGRLSSAITPDAPGLPASQPATPGGTPAPVVPVPQPPTGGGGPPPVCAAAGTAPASEPPLATRPPSAVDVTSAGINWHVRDSFTNYIATGEGTTVADGAVAAPASGTPPLLRDFSFPLRDGWFDAASGAAALRFTGCVRFAYAGHGIQIDAQEPEIELNATAPRAIFRFSGSSTKPGRGVLANLTLKPPTVSADGHTRTWTELAGAIPPGAASSVFAGFYLPGEEFGWFSVSVTT